MASVPVSPERFELVTRLHPQLLPLLKTPRSLGALPREWGDWEKLRFVSHSLNPPKKTQKREKEAKVSIVTSDTLNTCSALITIPCFSEIVSDAIFSPNYFPLLWGMGSRLEPEEAARAGQIGGWWAGDYLEGYREGHLHCRAEGKEGKEGKEVHFRVKVHFHV